jgi:hypothetical protein
LTTRPKDGKHSFLAFRHVTGSLHLFFSKHCRE